MSGNRPHPDVPSASADAAALPSRVHDLGTLVGLGAKFSTIYADPPWPYSNTAARGAAENHYPTMTLRAIRAEPVKRLAAENSHLHLWTTNAFLRDAFDVIRAWGFRYKSCLVWIKPQLGMGNYWRVSHEYLLLGVRGNLRFADHSRRSWLSARRTIHSPSPSRFVNSSSASAPVPTWSFTAGKSSPTAAGRSTAIRLNGVCFESRR